MRTTLRIDDNLLVALKDVAHKEKIPLTQVVNRVLRIGLRARQDSIPSKSLYAEKVFELGRPFVNLDKALAISAHLEDEEILRKIEIRK
ncbi:MAG: DUF2191 domain-containing protein [Thiohalomonadales bacterium]